MISREDMEWADIVFVMEKRHRNKIQGMFKDLYGQKRIICLWIPDEFEFMEPGLIALLEQRVTPYLQGIISTSIGIQESSS